MARAGRSRMLAHVVHTWGVCSQSHLKESPGARSTGTSNSSMRVHWKSVTFGVW